MRWSGGLRRIGNCQIKQPLDGAHACDELSSNLFCCKQRQTTYSVLKRNATHCISPYAIHMFVCLCVCVYAAFVDLRKRFEIETSTLFQIARNDTEHKPIRVLHKSDYKFQDGGQMAAVKQYN